MSESLLTPSIDEAERAFPGDSFEMTVCRYIFRRLAEIGPAADHFDLGSVASALGWHSSDQTRAIVSALDFLSFCSRPVLSRHFALWGDNSDEILEQPIAELSDEAIRQALETNELINPVTGESIPDFTNRITVEYSLESNTATVLKTGARRF